MKRTTTLIVVIHTFIAAILVIPALQTKPVSSESWPFFGAFFLDFPVSVLFHLSVEHGINPLVKMAGMSEYGSIAKYWFAFCHFVFGAMWWVFLSRLARKARAFLYRHIDEKA